MFKVNNKDTRTMSLTSKLTHFIPCYSVSIVNFEYKIDGWVYDPLFQSSHNNMVLKYANFSNGGRAFFYYQIKYCWCCLTTKE